MKILHRGKTKEVKDNWFWRCPKCHTIGYHETEDGYKGICCGEYQYFFCPVCGEQIRDNRYFNRLIAWMLWMWYECKNKK